MRKHHLTPHQKPVKKVFSQIQEAQHSHKVKQVRDIQDLTSELSILNRIINFIFYLATD